MGKKRRLMSSTKKFAAKHRNHPRMKMILAVTTTEVTTAVVPEVTSIPKPEIAFETPTITLKAPPPITETVIKAKQETVPAKPAVSTTKAVLTEDSAIVTATKPPPKKKMPTYKTAHKTTKKKTR